MVSLLLLSRSGVAPVFMPARIDLTNAVSRPMTFRSPTRICSSTLLGQKTVWAERVLGRKAAHAGICLPKPLALKAACAEDSAPSPQFLSRHAGASSNPGVGK